MGITKIFKNCQVTEKKEYRYIHCVPCEWGPEFPGYFLKHKTEKCVAAYQAGWV